MKGRGIGMRILMLDTIRRRGSVARRELAQIAAVSGTTIKHHADLMVTAGLIEKAVVNGRIVYTLRPTDQ